MKKLWYYLSFYKKETILAPVFKMLEALFELIIPLVVADIIDNGIGNNDTGYIVNHGILMIILGLIGFAVSVTAQYFAAKSAIGSCQLVRRDLFYHITELTYKELDETGTSRLITSMTSDINITELGINRVLRIVLRSPFIIMLPNC